MITDSAWTRVVFENVPLKGIPENVLRICAAIMAHGFWYHRGSPWFEDALLGPAHVQNFRTAKASDLRRRIVTKWEATIIKIEGDPMTAPDVADRLTREPRFLAFSQRLPRFEGIYSTLIRQAQNLDVSVCAEHYGRQLILPVHGKVEIKTAMAKEYEG